MMNDNFLDVNKKHVYLFTSDVDCEIIRVISLLLFMIYLDPLNVPYYLSLKGP